MSSAHHILGLRLPHPICVGSGMITDQRRQISRLLELGAAAVVTKTVFAGARVRTDEKIRFFAHGAVNSTTFSHRPLDSWLRDLEELARRHANIVVSLHGASPEALNLLALRVADVCPFPFELGIACPTDGSDLSISPTRIHQYVDAALDAGRPLAVKLCANEHVVQNAWAAARAGAAALSISDSLPGLLLAGTPRRRACEGAMGYSGPGIRPIALLAISRVREACVPLPIWGIGGISTGEDVLDYLSLGCPAVQVYTELMTHGMERLPAMVSEWRGEAFAAAGPEVAEA